ncbi:MAG: DNA polymerase II large subunit [Candidatus Micrarchaeota archaeon]|nr:DNA polymerase II large subunit [Candidatus Micrarchaeota archaeon]
MTDQYFGMLDAQFARAFAVAERARSMGYDPEPHVEIKPAPDIATRVEGIIGVEGLAGMINRLAIENRQELAFSMVREICTGKEFETETADKKLTLASRVGLAILTEGVVVAATEGLQGVELHKNADGSDYIAVLYAGPIRGAGGTSMALSVALADYGRKLLNIGRYQAQKSEVERCVEEVQIYDSRCARLQYRPNDKDIRTIIESCPVCVDGLPTEQIELSIHRNIKRLDAAGKEQMISNRVRGGICLVLCEGIAQKAKSVLKHAKNAGLDWSWLNETIKVDKKQPSEAEKSNKESVFLQELIAGRPVLAYPGHVGSFRLRYGRSRMTGIAAKGFSPASMHLLDEFIACGTQLKIEKPGKGCVATPVDSIEGPFVKLDDGRALRINDIATAKELHPRVKKIIAVGDVLITYGDFKKSNTPLVPTSYVEEYWTAQLNAKGVVDQKDPVSYREAYDISMERGVPMHPRYIYEYAEIETPDLIDLWKAVALSRIKKEGKSVFDVSSIEIDSSEQLVLVAERLCIPHVEENNTIRIEGDDAQSLMVSFGFSQNGELHVDGSAIKGIDQLKSPLEILNDLSPVQIMKRSTRLGGRIGRPEKARERLMKPAPHALFPIGEYGGKERSVSKAYANSKRKFKSEVEVEAARFKCPIGKETLGSPYCRIHQSRTRIEKICKSCGREGTLDICGFCEGKTSGSEVKRLDIAAIVDDAMRSLEMTNLPKIVKGVKGLSSRDKIPEPIEKGILRAANNVYIFKDGTSRFDATDVPMTHFYPSEAGISLEKLAELGYTLDYKGNKIESVDQLVELRHQDVLVNRRCANYTMGIAKFVDELLEKYYGMEPFYNLSTVDDLIGHLVITLSPHTSAGVLCRIIGFTDANVGFAHPYVISARRRNCDGDEDTTMLLLDALINFSKSYLPTTIGGTMDAPIILTIKVEPKDVDDEVHDMEVTEAYGLDFYDKTMQYAGPGEVSVDLVKGRLGGEGRFSGINFTHMSGPRAVAESPIKSMYTKLNTIQEKIDQQFKLMDRLCSVERSDAARRLISSHFIPDLIGNMHKFSKQGFRCISCNAKYRRVPLVGKCTRCQQGKLVLTISKGSIEKYLNMAIALANRYNLEQYIKQRLYLIRDEIQNVFGGVGGGNIPTKQFNLAKFM